MGTQSPEPPIDQWQEELKNRPKGSEESLAEVMRESEARKKSQSKGRKVKGSSRSFRDYFRRGKSS
ncbi:MAG TPA: hypothetical protein VF307_03200 [Candidatus Nanopelagicaceae bacterium]